MTHARFLSETIYETLESIYKNSGPNNGIRISQLTVLLGIAEQDTRSICRVLERMLLVQVWLHNDGDHEYILTATGKAHVEFDLGKPTRMHSHT